MAMLMRQARQYSRCQATASHRLIGVWERKQCQQGPRLDRRIPPTMAADRTKVLTTPHRIKPYFRQQSVHGGISAQATGTIRDPMQDQRPARDR
jgi:hypothetical protein